jgi:hypothetical protein
MTEMIPDITRPPGVVHVDGWHLGDRPHRFLYGKRREVPRPAVDVSVGIIAVQLDDGSIDDGSVIEAPKVFVDCGEDDSLTPAQARQVARAIMGAVDGLDGDDGPSSPRGRCPQRPQRITDKPFTYSTGWRTQI